MTDRLSFIPGLGNATIQQAGEDMIFPASAVLPAVKEPTKLRLATFNIQVFGKAKAEDRRVMNVLAHIFRQFDVIAVQEIRSKEVDPVNALRAQINSRGAQYDYVISDRLGRTDSKEQYAFFWDTSRVEIVPDSAYLVNDEGDFMHREPFVASFRARNVTGGQPFSFTLINAHTDPDETTQELNVMDDVFQSVQAYEYTEDDVIVLGDLNVDVEGLGELGRIPQVASLTREKTNTVGSKIYDHIVIDRSRTVEVLQAGVINYERDLGLTLEDAKLVSDHRPVWAEFDMFEHPQQTSVLAARPGDAPR